MNAPDGWAWDEVHSNDHDNEVVNWTLPAGAHTLEIAKREDGVYLDAILITDSLNLDQRVLPPDGFAADLNENKKVDLKDYAVLAEMWLDGQMWP
jgi:hypothetical protein